MGRFFYVVLSILIFAVVNYSILLKLSFTTAFDEYALKAFDAAAIDYLLKPFSKDRFKEAIEKWRISKNDRSEISNIDEATGKQPDEHLRIVVKDKGNIHVIPTVNIFYIEAYDDYVKIHTQDRTYLKKKTMHYYEKSLNKIGFFRIHRSYILNINHLTRIETFEKNSYHAILTNGVRISISRNCYSDLKRILGL